MKNKITVFALSSSVELAQDICDNLGCEMGKSKVHHFADGEILVEIDESVREKMFSLSNQHLILLLKT